MGKDPRSPIQRVDWKARCLKFEARCAELESALEDSSAALDLVPIGPLEAGQTWFPSEVAIQRLKRAKDSVSFIERRWHGGGRP